MPYIGHFDLSVFFSVLQKSFKKLTVDASDIQIINDQATVCFKAEAICYNDTIVKFSGQEIFTFDTTTALILSVKVYHDTKAIAD